MEGFCYLLCFFIPPCLMRLITILMCDRQNKVHSYLAHSLFAPVQVEMRGSGDFFNETSIRHLCVICCFCVQSSFLGYLYRPLSNAYLFYS